MKESEPVVAVDVSKSKLSFRAFPGRIPKREMKGKAREVPNEHSGFLEIAKACAENGADGALCPVVLEATGNSHVNLAHWLTSKGIGVYVIHPTRSSRQRQAEGGAKNDDLDCLYMSHVHYDGDSRLWTKGDDEIVEAKWILRRREGVIDSMTVAKCQFRSTLSHLWPGFPLDPYQKAGTAILLKYKDPATLAEAKPSAVAKALKKAGAYMAERVAEEMVAYAKRVSFGQWLYCEAEPDWMADELSRIMGLQAKADKLAEKAISLMRPRPGFDHLRTIFGVGELGAATLLAEAGDVSRFESSKAFVRFCRAAPLTRQSGQYDGKGLPRDRSGNHRIYNVARTAVLTMVRLKAQNAVTRYVHKKKSDGKLPNQAVADGAGKLIRIIYSMLRKGTDFKAE